MAHVVTLAQDLDVQAELNESLYENGHVVLSVQDALHALAALKICRYPAIVIIHAPTASDGGFVLLRRAAISGKRLARHSYILLTVDAAMNAARWAMLERLNAQALELPFELEAVVAAVKDADDEQLSQAQGAPTVHAMAPRSPTEG